MAELIAHRGKKPGDTAFIGRQAREDMRDLPHKMAARYGDKKTAAAAPLHLDNRAERENERKADQENESMRRGLKRSEDEARRDMARKGIRSYRRGGAVRSTGIAFLHKGERVVPSRGEGRRSRGRSRSR